jgi:hypothetical protein
MVTLTADRVNTHTDPEVNRDIAQSADMRITYLREHPELIPKRLMELDAEWDVERALETASAGFSLLGIGLGFARGRRWFLLPLVVQGFFLQHALQGWCPPLPVLRRLGFRTQQEIQQERHALLHLLNC